MCPEVGDRDEAQEGHLMYIWVDGWVHVNCAFWAFGVYDNSDGVWRPSPAALHLALLTRVLHRAADQSHARHQHIESQGMLQSTLLAAIVYVTYDATVQSCTVCHERGAATKCIECKLDYHLGCALKAGCRFYADKSVRCAEHALPGVLRVVHVAYTTALQCPAPSQMVCWTPWRLRSRSS